jgi:xanthine dehydrogenase accessory factor
MLVYADERSVGTVVVGVESWVIEEAKEAIAVGEDRELHYSLVDEDRGDRDICGGGMRIFAEPLVPRPLVLVIGAGHVGQAVAELADYLGYRIEVLDERPGLLTAERFPWAGTLLTGDVAEEVRNFGVDEHTYVVMVTPHHSPDEKVLKVVADRPFAYVGLIGSQRRTIHTFERAREAGVPESVLEQVHTPIGLDIGAETLREIAASITVEIIAVQRAPE